MTLYPEFKIDANTPPTFLIQAENDGIPVECSLTWFRDMKRAGAPAELHCYATGGHGYGILRTGEPIADWPCLAADWFRRQANIK